MIYKCLAKHKIVDDKFIEEHGCKSRNNGKPCINLVKLEDKHDI